MCKNIVKLAVGTLWSNRYDWVLAMYIMGNSLINIIGKEIRDNEKINVRKSINVVIVSSIYIC